MEAEKGEDLQHTLVGLFKRPSIEYVTLFLMIFDLPPPVTNSHKSWTPKSMSHFWTKS